MILVQMYNVFRLLIGVPDYSIAVSRSYGGKQKHVENDGHLNKHFCFFGEYCLKKNQIAPRLSNDISTDVQHI